MYGWHRTEYIIWHCYNVCVITCSVDLCFSSSSSVFFFFFFLLFDFFFCVCVCVCLLFPFFFFFFFFFCCLVKIICLCTCLYHHKKFKKRIVLIADDALHASPLPSSLSVLKYLKNRCRMCYVKVPPEYHSAQRKSP